MKTNLGNRMSVKQLQEHLNTIIENGHGDSAFWLGEYFITNENVDIKYKENNTWKKKETNLPYSLDEDAVGFSAIHVQDYNDLVNPVSKEDIIQGKKQKDVWKVHGYILYLEKEMNDRYTPSNDSINKLADIKSKVTTENYENIIKELDLFSANIQKTSSKLNKVYYYIDYLIGKLIGDEVTSFNEKLLGFKQSLTEDNCDFIIKESEKIEEIINK